MIGVAGCGRMGAPMLAALRRAGFDARGFDIRPPGSFGAMDPYVTQSADLFLQDLTILISVVRDIPQIEDVLFGEQSFIHAKNLRCVIICSTLSPRYVQELRDRTPGAISLIDAPMSGAQVAAEQATLSFMLGGDAKVLDAAQPLFDAMGSHFHRMGEFGAGMQAKVLNNLLAASHTAMTRFVLDCADKAGMDRQSLLNLIHTSSGQNWFASGFDRIEFARDGLREDNTIGILVKDIDSALDALPDGCDPALPMAVQSAIQTLKPLD